MKIKRLVMSLLVVVLLMSAALTTSAQEMADEMARVRVAHFAVDAPAVDVFVNGEAVLTEVAYPAMSGYLEVPAGTYSIAVAPAGAGIDAAVIGPVDLTFEAGNDYTIAATGQLADESFGPIVINETLALEGTDPVEAKVLVLHGISDAPAVDIILEDGTALAEALPFNEYGVLSVPAGEYPILVTAAGDPETVVFDELNPVTLSAGRLYFLAAIGAFPGDFRLFAEITPTANIAELVAGLPGFSTLLAAVQAADLGEALSGEGPFTVFAPTDEAFAAAFEALGIEPAALLADTATLTDILLYHVVSGAALSTDVVGLDAVETLQGSEISISIEDGRVFLNGSIEVIVVDILATNGVIHVINGVLLPPAE